MTKKVITDDWWKKTKEKSLADAQCLKITEKVSFITFRAKRATFIVELYVPTYLKFHAKIPDVPTSFRQEFSKKSLIVTNSEKSRESLFTF